MKTLGRLEAQTGFTDAQLFIGASDFLPLVVAGAPVASAGAGLYTRNVPASTTANLFANISTLFRTGQLAVAGTVQQEFGTAALVPGPSSVANTSDPLNLPPSFPPNWNPSATYLPTLTGGYKGAIPKGIKFVWVDAVYEVDTGAITSATLGFTNTQMPPVGTSAAPTVTNIIALAANSLPVAANTAGQATRTRVTVPTAAAIFYILDGSEFILNINFVSPASNTVKFYGCVVGCHFNYN
jgi:hypothetical protein